MGKELWTDQKEGEPISVYSAYNEDDEARYIVGSIQNWVNQGRSLDEVAILYRSNAQSRVLEEAILREALPYKNLWWFKILRKSRNKKCYELSQTSLRKRR